MFGNVKKKILKQSLGVIYWIYVIEMYLRKELYRSYFGLSPVSAPRSKYLSHIQQILPEILVTSGAVVVVGFPLFCSNKHGAGPGLLWHPVSLWAGLELSEQHSRMDSLWLCADLCIMGKMTGNLEASGTVEPYIFCPQTTPSADHIHLEMEAAHPWIHTCTH